MKRFSLLFAFAALAAIDAAAQTVTVGRLYPQGGSGSVGGSSAPFTVVDVMHPVTANGVLRNAVVRWTAAPAPPCGNAYKLKFLRPSGTSYTVIAERGPFAGNNGRNDVALSPEVSVQAGDVIALVQLQAGAACGNVVMTLLNEVASLAGNVEVTTGTTLLGPVAGSTPAIFAASDANVVSTIIPVAGATRGNFGSFFRTALQLTGTDSTPVSGSLVYHPAGQVASPSDPSVKFTLNQRQTVSFPDFVTSLGLAGLGSVDVVTDGMPPVITARVFNDAGVDGTSGFTEEAIAPTAALQAPQVAVLTLPIDVSTFRVRIGVRTLGAPVQFTVGRYSNSGTLVVSPNVGKEYPANYFEQVSLEDFAGNAALVNDGLLSIEMLSGQAIVYATITDNRTNDSSIVFAVPTR